MVGYVLSCASDFMEFFVCYKFGFSEKFQAHSYTMVIKR